MLGCIKEVHGINTSTIFIKGVKYHLPLLHCIFLIYSLKGIFVQDKAKEEIVGFRICSIFVLGVSQENVYFEVQV